MISKDYLYTDIYDSLPELLLEDNSLYIYGNSDEDRGNAVAQSYFQNHENNVYFLRLRLSADDFDEVYDDAGNKYNLRSIKDITSVLSLSQTPQLIYLDVTVLHERIIAAILHYAYINEVEVRIIYVEPLNYKVCEFQKAGVYHDLAAEINGIAPLPGFIAITPDDNNEVPTKLVVFIGFEGGRFTHIYEQYDISGDNVLPIVGAPGYRIEYPFMSLWGNRQIIYQSGAWRNIRYCTANSIVDAYCRLLELIKSEPATMFKIVPIGTKPHTIAALAFALKYSSKIEIVYDNPKLGQRRSNGVGAIIETKLNKLMAGEIVE